MTTYTAFVPVNNGAFQFQPTLDGAVYTCIVTWNVYGQRWYVNIYDTSGNLVLCRPLIGSPAGYGISLTGGYFTSTMVFRQATQTFEVSP